MDQNIWLIVGAILLDGLAGLAGGLLPQAFVQRHITSLLAFAAGTLISATFLDLLPHALSSGAPASQILAAALAGFTCFYAIETFIGSHAAGQGGHKHDTIGPMLLIGDAIHNATDGIALAAAFLIDVKTGLATTLAVLVHELPQEIGDYAILIGHGYSRGRALFWLFLVQLSAFVGAAAALWVASLAHASSPLLLSVSAGGFLYIASANLLPELHRQKQGGAVSKLLAFCSGLGTIAILEILLK
ncbi:MAG: ZIP family metal transporter [Deltaproteobacteria bacterium]|nr:ZIP family metal transporter [Deltaproteobacteria bacterium]